jgi:hypothetical protein
LKIPLIFKSSSLLGTPIGEWIMFIVGTLTIWFAIGQFRADRRKKRSEAAICALSLMQYFVNFINEIAQKTALFEYEGYYPFKVPEIASKDDSQSRFSERPYRLIFNEFNEFKYNFNKQLAQIGGREVEPLLVLLVELQKNALFLGSLLSAKSKSNSTARPTFIDGIDEANRQNIEMSKETIKKCEEQIIVILMPIAYGSSWWSKITSICFWIK